MSEPRKQEPRRWRKFKEQPRAWFLDWPAMDWEPANKRFMESPGDPIIVYDSCNGFSLWGGSPDDPVPPAEMWIAMPKRPRK